MRRVRRHLLGPSRSRAWWMLVLAVVGLLSAPVLVSPAQAHGAAAASGCGMAMAFAASPMTTRAPTAGAAHSHDAACAAACAVCAQIAPAREDESAIASPAAPDRVEYPRSELRLAGVEPERGTPPPR